MAAVRHLGGDRWKVTVSLGAKGDGTYARTYRTVRAKNLTAARRMARDLESELATRRAVLTSERATLADVIEAWWAVWSLQDRSPTTRDEYRRLIDRRIIPGPLGQERIRDLHRGDFSEWYVHLRAGGLSPASVRRIHAVVRQALDYAEGKGWLVANPAARAKLPAAEQVERRRPTELEVLAVLVAAKARHEMRAGALLFAARTSLRRGEVAGVRWSRIKGDRLLVDTNVVSTKAEAKHVKAPKGRKAATILLDEETLEVVEEQQAWQSRTCADTGLRLPVDPWLWSRQPPFVEPLAPRTLTRWMEEAREDAGVASDVRLHDLRHWSASMLSAAIRAVPGASLSDVQRRLRHAQLSTTMGYLHASGDDGIERDLLAQLPSLRALPAGEGWVKAGSVADC